VSFVRMAWVVGGLFLVTLCVLAGLGVSALVGPLVTLAVLVLLIAGGSYLHGSSR
jgi:hypothetical protein